ncbi:MFS transporter [Aquibacillus sp. 3ASR75-11]|uniref:MFS transporter n=1 Tax=Terrihalobacillus insolitus TaxID=2950438 RepID=A0A9X3WXZ6_9BACI|nr:MFS transporter [Terrihalobacillus insolitus]MDC3414479.1 MFS transporter [Terrihalobacillus insolitus]MDC3425359.1 MFS transporter [Terrihalobacillus insolitus]
MGNNQRHLLLIVTIALGVLLNPLNSSMIAVALSRIQQDFQLSFSDASWLISTYYLASAVGQPVMGKLSDIFGRKRLFLLGLTMVAVASILAPLSPGFGWLIGFRIIQSLGSSTLFPAGMGIVRQVITHKQAKALGVLSVFSSVSAAFGPSIGGFLIQFGDWPAIFFINFPFIILSFVLSIKVLPKDPPPNRKDFHLDYVGILLFTGMIMSWLLFFMSFEETVSWWKLLLSLVVSFLFYHYEVRQKDPFIDVLGLKKNINVTFVYIQFILVNILFYSLFFGVPTYLQTNLKLDAKNTGIMMLSIAGFGMIIAPIAGKWIDQSGSKPILFVGSISLIIGTLMILTIQDESSLGWIFFALSFLGVSNGFNNLGMQTALYDFVTPEETSAASGLFMTSRYIGTILSSSLLGILFGKNVTTENFHIIGVIGSIIGVCILLLTIRLPNRKRVRGKIGEH